LASRYARPAPDPALASRPFCPQALGTIAAFFFCSGCSLLIDSDDVTFSDPRGGPPVDDLPACTLGDPSFVKPTELHRQGWFGFYLAATDDTVVALAPSEADRSPQPANGALGQIPEKASSFGRIYFFERQGQSLLEAGSSALNGAEHIEAILPNSEIPGPFEPVILPAFNLAMDRDTVVVGVAGDGRIAPFRGSVRLFERKAEAWQERSDRLEEPSLRENDLFGLEVAVSPDLLVVSAPGTDVVHDDGSGPRSVHNAGAVYLYARSSGQYRASPALTSPFPDDAAGFGGAIALSDQWLAVSAPLEDRGPINAGNSGAEESALNDGAVYVYARKGDDVDREHPELVSLPSGISQHNFGSRLALRGTTLFVGAVFGGGCSGNQGVTTAAVHVFERGESWIHRQCLEARIPFDLFGFDFSLNDQTLAISAPWSDPSGDSTKSRGEVFLFDSKQPEWATACRITGPNGDWGDSFGASTAFVGEDLVVSAPLEDSSGLGPGAKPGDNDNLDTGAMYVYPTRR